MLVLLILIGGCVAQLPPGTRITEMGACNKNVTTDSSTEFSLLAFENGGFWFVLKTIKTPFTETLQNLTYFLQPTGTDEYTLLMTYVTKDGETGNLANTNMTDLGGGKLTSNGTVNGIEETFSVFVTKYVPGRYAYIYICAYAGEDTNHDYRYVLTHNALEENEEQEIKQVDKDNGFVGELITLSK